VRSICFWHNGSKGVNQALEYNVKKRIQTTAMNTLLIFIRANRLKPSEVMNRLQDAAVISDNCVTVADVAEVDQTKAVEWLKLNP